jgi:hypothetical protein
MSWAGIASNQCVSLDNLINAVATGVFTALTTIPSGSKQITKSEALTYVNIQTAPLAGKTNNQLVVKSNLQAPIVTYYNVISCIGTSGIVKYNGPATLTIGSYVFTNTNYTCNSISSVGTGPETFGTILLSGISDCSECFSRSCFIWQFNNSGGLGSPIESWTYINCSGVSSIIYANPGTIVQACVLRDTTPSIGSQGHIAVKTSVPC